MRQILLVANQTATSEPLYEAVRDRIAGGPCEFTLVMPLTSTDEITRSDIRYLGESAGPFLGEGPGPNARYKAPRQRLDDALGRLRELGASVTGEVGQKDAVASEVEISRRHQFDEIIISTLPRRVSHWLRQDEPSRVERKTRLPVTVVSGV